MMANHLRFLYSVLILVFITPVAFTQNIKTDPEELFRHPPENARPGVLWMWMGTNITKEGITKDLEALKKAGFNRTTMFSLSDITIPWNVPIYKSSTPEIITWTEPWWKMLRFAAQESKRLGMDFGMYNGAGYESSGGTWITPELSMQQICWSESRVNGNDQPLTYWLPRPAVNPRSNMPFPVYNSADSLVENVVIPARSSYYKDIAVIAIPVSTSIKKEEVLNITSTMDSTGILRWKAPKGEWIIYRFGHTTMGALIQPAQPQAVGLECDKMNADAVNFHMDNIIGDIQKHVGDLIGTGFTHVHFDSYEAGMPSWTPKMATEFMQRRGYSLLSYLPTFAGKAIGGSVDSAKFVADFDATIKDLYRDIYFKTISRRLKEANLTFLAEPYGGPWRQDDVLPLVHNVMTEFWTNNGKYSPYELDPTVAALRESGQNIIEAEAFTGQPADSKWSEYPAWLKPIGDAAFCAGVNRMILHRFTHQPWNEKYKPGNSMGQWGTHFDRTQTWWEPGKALVEYWQRCQALLQWGSFVPTTTTDFVATHLTDSIELRNIHRRSAGTDIYFVANTSHHTGSATCMFNVDGKQPELWDPVSGDIRELNNYIEKDGKTEMPIFFEDAQSYFIVFRKKAGNKISPAPENFSAFNHLLTINKPWQVSFDHVWGGPSIPVLFKKLEDWTQRSEKGIKYYSGTASYQTTFNMPAVKTVSSKKLYLDLGKVNHIAKVKLNDKELGVVWTAPWGIAIPDGLLKKENNKLIIEVTNTWVNRLIGDEQEPQDMQWLPGQYFYWSGQYLKEFPDWFLNNTVRPSKGRYCFTTWNYFDKDSPLMPSGLLGPVRILERK